MPPDPPFPISLSQPEIRTSPPLPLTQAGCPVHNYELSKRYHPDPLPEPPRPTVQLDNVGALSLHILPCINLIVRDTFKTIWLAVTLEGTIIHKSGLITGGRSSHGNNKKWDEKDVQGMLIDHFPINMSWISSDRFDSGTRYVAS